MKYDQLLEQVRQEVSRLFKQNQDGGLIYHDLEHTASVARYASELARHYKLNEQETFIVLAAAWFHDIGYHNGGSIDHELRGADRAEIFLKDKLLDPQVIVSVRGCILATRLPQSPSNLLEQIVCDADLYHLGTDSFNKLNKLMRKELELRKGEKIPKEDWRKSTIALMESHHFHTDYVRNRLDEEKGKNLARIKEKENNKSEMRNQKPGNESKAQAVIIPAQAESANAQKGTDKKKSSRPERGIETMFRVSSSNHQRLSDMADNKAHIMITTTSIIISVLLSLLLRKLEDNPHLLLPTTMLLAVCVITMVFSILATRPSLPPGTFSQEQVNSKKVNLLFFGNFYRMSFEEYEEGMKQVMNDRDFLYGSLTRDVYSQGIVLGRKYRLLRKGYSVFMYGVVASVITFIIAVIFFK